MPVFVGAHVAEQESRVLAKLDHCDWTRMQTVACTNPSFPLRLGHFFGAIRPLADSKWATETHNATELNNAWLALVWVRKEQSSGDCMSVRLGKSSKKPPVYWVAALAILFAFWSRRGVIDQCPRLHLRHPWLHRAGRAGVESPPRPLQRSF